RTGTTVDGGVVVGQVDVDFLDGIHRHRLTLGRQVVRLQTERIARADAVDADGVEAGVLATGGDRTVRLADLRDTRVKTDVILDVAVGRRQRFHLLAGHVGAGTHLVGTEDFRATGHGHHLHRFQRGRSQVAGQGGIDGVDLVQVQVHAVFGLGAFTRLGDGDGVRTTHAQAARVVTTGGVSGCTADRARLDVGDGDFSTSHRRAAVVDDLAADAGGGALGKRRRSRKCGHETKGKLGHPNAWVIHCG